MQQLRDAYSYHSHTSTEADIMEQVILLSVHTKGSLYKYTKQSAILVKNLL